MRQYLMSLFVLALCCAVVELLSPEGEGGGIARHIRLLSGLCLLLFALTPAMSWVEQGRSPLGALSDALDEWIAQSETSGDAFRERWEQQSEQIDLNVAAETVAEMIEERFSLAASDCRVTLKTDARNQLEEVCVALSGRAIWIDAQQIQAMVRETLGCACTVYVE
jgi:hypothetical protein